MPIKPEVLQINQVAKSKLFLVEELKLRFSNGVQRTYERLASRGHGAVMMIVLDSDNHLLLVREYAGGIDDYTLSLPKGAVDEGETIYQAADRELKEEIGFGARRIDFLKELTTAPNYMGHKLQAVIARDLYPCRLVGDEPEPLEVVKWPLSDIDALALNPEFTEGRAIAGLYMARHYIETHQ
ncbi:MAG: putative MutT/nudix family protein [Osedax symbiont Rs1]|nr:MAG: putative MutT/nudix family protein [Osedax symbiont Rs1]